jgi:single-strand DNA-binding protein
MSNITMVGTLGKDPETKISASGVSRTLLRIAETVNGGKDNEKTHWYDWMIFGDLGEHVAASLSKGQRVILEGRPETYQREVTINGEVKNITQTSFVAFNAGVDLRFHTAEVTKASGGAAKAAPARAAASAPAKAAAKPVDDDEDF